MYNCNIIPILFILVLTFSSIDKTRGKYNHHSRVCIHFHCPKYHQTRQHFTCCFLPGKQIYVTFLYHKLFIHIHFCDLILFIIILIIFLNKVTGTLSTHFHPSGLLIENFISSIVCIIYFDYWNDIVISTLLYTLQRPVISYPPLHCLAFFYKTRKLWIETVYLTKTNLQCSSYCKLVFHINFCDLILFLLSLLYS